MPGAWMVVMSGAVRGLEVCAAGPQIVASQAYTWSVNRPGLSLGSHDLVLLASLFPPPVCLSPLPSWPHSPPHLYVQALCPPGLALRPLLGGQQLLLQRQLGPVPTQVEVRGDGLSSEPTVEERGDDVK